MLDRLLETQKAAWARGERRSVESIVAEECSANSTEILDRDLWLSLICSENAIRKSLGESPTLQEYQGRFPQLSDELEVQWEINAMLGSMPAELQVEPRSRALNTAPSSVGRYSIRREIGRGAMGVVYEAYDPKLKRIVAIKRLRSGSDADESELQRISSEAESIAQLNHPHIVQLFDVEMDNDIPHLVMEYCTGGTLESYMNGKPLDSKHAVNLMLQIAAGVAAAHAAGIVHRDLKPANVMLDSPLSLKPKVSDFGLAKRLGLDSNATATGTLIGSPAYMPPEQANGVRQEVGPAADVYSLGAVLYECLTGRPPFRGTSLVDTLDQVRTREPVQVRQLEPRVPRDLETIVHKCLRKRADQRYSNATEFADDLRRFVNHQPIHARRESWFEASSRIYRRYPLASSLSAVTALLLLVLTIGSLLFARQVNSLLRQSELIQADALIGRAHGFRLSRGAGQRFEALTSLSKATDIGRKLGLSEKWFETVRDETIAALMLPDIYVENWHEEPAKPYSADYSDDHLHYAVGFEELDEIVVRSLATHDEIGRIPKVDKATRVRWVGNSLIFLQGSQNQHCELWDVANKPYKKRWSEDGCGFFNFSNDQQLLIIANAHWMQVVEVESGKVLSKFPSSPFARDPHMAFHPSEPLIVCCSYFHNDLEIRNWRTGEIQELRTGEASKDERNCFSAVWSPDGKTLIAIQGDGVAAYRYDVDSTGKFALKQTDRPSKIGNAGGPIIRFNQRGDRVLGRSWSPELELFDVEVNHRLFVGGNALLLDNGHVSEYPRIDPQERFGSFGKKPTSPNSLGLTSIALGRETKVISPGAWSHFGGITDPTNRFLLSAFGNELLIVDATSGRPIIKKKLIDSDALCFSFDRVGNFYINGHSGSYRWPYKISESPPLKLELGIPQRVHLPFGVAVIGCSDDGLTVGAGVVNGYGTQEYAGGWIKIASEPASIKVFGGRTGHALSVSADGKRVAGNAETQTLVWDCEKKLELIQVLPGEFYPRFSRDGTNLLAGRKLYRTRDWSPTVSFNEGEPYDLSNDGLQVIFHKADGTLGLASTVSGETLARFAMPDKLLYPTFSPNGENITCWTPNQGTMLINFRKIRESLVEKGLDWKAPAYDSQFSRASAQRIESSQVHRDLENVESADELSELVDREAIRRSQQYPNDPDATFSAAIVFIEQCDYPSAMKLLDRTCELIPSSISVRQWRAYLFAAMRDYERAILDANWVLEHFENSDFLLLRAEWHLQAKHYDAAVTDCSRVIDKGDYWAKYAFGLRATCYEALGNDVLASQDQTKFIEQTRFDSKSLNYAAEPMSGMDISLRHPALALRVLRKLQSLNENLPNRIQQAVARVLYINDHYDEAVEHLEACLAKGSEQYESSNLYLLAMTKFQLGQHESAREIFARAEACPIPPTFDFRARRNLRMLQAECKSLLQHD